LSEATQRLVATPGKVMSHSSETLDEIQEVNQSYLLLAQRLLREDRATGMARMGVSAPLADLLADLTLAQTGKLAASNQLLCRFRFDDHAVLSMLADKADAHVPAHPHAALVTASQPVQQTA